MPQLWTSMVDLVAFGVFSKTIFLIEKVSYEMIKENNGKHTNAKKQI